MMLLVYRGDADDGMLPACLPTAAVDRESSLSYQMWKGVLRSGISAFSFHRSLSFRFLLSSVDRGSQRERTHSVTEETIF